MARKSLSHAERWTDPAAAAREAQRTGSNRRYKVAADLIAQRLEFAERHIATLESENARLRRENEALQTPSCGISLDRLLQFNMAAGAANLRLIAKVERLERRLARQRASE